VALTRAIVLFGRAELGRIDLVFNAPGKRR